MDLTFVDNHIQVIMAINDKAYAVLEECAGELESQTKRNTAVDTGQTKNSWQHRVTSRKGEYTAVVGSDYENAIWEEFGTGEYAMQGGRKGGWVYRDAKGNYHFTRGKHPRQAFTKAHTALKNPIINHIQNAFEGL